MSLRSPTRRIAPLILAVLLSFGCVAPAFGDQISDKKAQAAAVQTQISDLDAKAEVATERYNVANDRLGHVTAQAKASERKIAQLKARTKKLQTGLDSRVAEMYRNPLVFLDVLLSSRSFDDFNTMLAVLTSISSKDANTVAQLKVTKAQADSEHAKLVSAQAEASRQRSAMKADSSAVRSQLAARQRVLSGLNADVKKLLAQQQAAENAAARQRALALRARQRAASSSGGSPSNSGGGSDSVPSSGSRGTDAVAWAEKALGRPYAWGGSGPDSFDCSGLTMWAYSHVGVSLPHSSSGQSGSGPHVSRDSLQPGDLVFFGSPIHHVGMYVGGGDFIESPHSGAVVKISSLSNRHDYAGACRP
jgi:cell wall-associated NlpC family hydrolase